MHQAIEFIKNKGILGFALYDFANSAYILIFNAFLFPIFLREHVFRGDPKSDFYWGLSLSISIVIALLLSPFVGYIADRISRKLLMSCIVAGVSGGILTLSLGDSSAPFYYLGVFVFTNSLYVISLTLYDSYLPHVGRSQDEMPTVSAFAWGLGYMGGVLCLGLVLLVQGGSADPSKEGFIATTLFYTVFSAISLTLLPRQTTQRNSVGLWKTARVFVTKNILILLISFWLINEAIDIIIYFTSLYAKETLHLGTETIGAFLIITQILAFPGTWLIGNLAAKRGQGKILKITLLLWILVVIWLVLSRTLTHFFLLALLTSLVIGSSQALMRSVFSSQFPKRVSGFSFGIYSIASRVTALFGPLIFGTISAVTGSQRIAMLAVIPFLLLGWFTFSRFQKSEPEQI